MSQALELLDPNSLAFPPLHNALAEPNGLLAVGGDLSVKRLYSAYQHGIFPWYSEHDPIMWWSPTPRAIITSSSIRINRTLNKHIKKKPYKVTLNHAFSEVIDLCADAPFRTDETWIVDDMIQAYQNLHDSGLAHSIEVWDGDELVGGLYGVAINGFFSGESMFYKKSNASKFALVALSEHLQTAGISMIDCQITNPFLEDMGCFELSRDEFIDMQKKHVDIMIPDGFWQPKELI